MGCLLNHCFFNTNNLLQLCFPLLLIVVGSPPANEAEENGLMIKIHEQQKVDLVQDTTDAASHHPFITRGNEPDVVESGSRNSGSAQASMDLLIDFSSEPGEYAKIDTPSENRLGIDSVARISLPGKLPLGLPLGLVSEVKHAHTSLF